MDQDRYERNLKRTAWGFVYSTLAIYGISIMIIIYDITMFYLTDHFVVFQDLNTYRFETFEESWAYAKHTPYLWAQEYIPAFLKYCLIQCGITMMVSVCMHFAHYRFSTRVKTVFLITFVEGIIGVGILFFFNSLIQGVYSEYYIRRMIHW